LKQQLSAPILRSIEAQRIDPPNTALGAHCRCATPRFPITSVATVARNRSDRATFSTYTKSQRDRHAA
jgi:hypothetical protein